MTTHSVYQKTTGRNLHQSMTTHSVYQRTTGRKTVSRDDSAKQKSIISPSFPKKWTRDKEVHEPSYSQTKTSRHKAWTEWAKHHLDFNEPAHAVISRAPISRAQCGTDSTDIKNKSNTTTSPTNKRARGIEDNGSHHRKGKTARYEGPYTIKSPSISTSTSRPSPRYRARPRHH